MKTIDVHAKTVEEALSKGLEELGVSIADVTYEVVDPGKKGLLGLIGSKEAVVRLTLNDEDDAKAKDLFELNADAKATEPSEKKAKPVLRETKPQKEQKAPAAVQPKEEKQAQPREEAVPAKTVPVKTVPVKTAPVKTAPAEVQQIAKPSAASDYPEGSAESKALDFLSNLTHLMGVDVQIYLSNDEPDTIRLNMFGDSKGVLIGRRGETLDSLQYLTSLYVNRGCEHYIRVTIDTENYRAKREDALIRLANRMANRAVKTGRKVVMEPMNPYERRIFHSALQQSEMVSTHSEGEEPNRHIVITLKSAAKASDKKN